MKDTETISVEDSMGFQYEVDISHSPHFGFSTAYWKGRVVGQCELYRVTQPFSDDDREWEMYEERLSEWRDEIVTNLKNECKKYFDLQT